MDQSKASRLSLQKVLLEIINAPNIVSIYDLRTLAAPASYGAKLYSNRKTHDPYLFVERLQYIYQKTVAQNNAHTSYNFNTITQT
jgi:hypothetical protein